MNELRYVYAVTRPFGAALPKDLVGVAGSSPYQLRHHELAAVVSDVPATDFDAGPLKERLEDIDWLSDTARAHEAVVATLVSVGSPLPLRLATICRGDSGVRRLLEAGNDRFVRTLERLDGRVEWGVKVYARVPASQVSSPAPTRLRASTDQAPGTGRDFLRRRLGERRQEEHSWQSAAVVARALHAELTSRAQATRLHRPQQAKLSGASGQNILNAAYLVPRDDSADFIGAVNRLLPDEPGMSGEVTGPWAPYSFTEDPSDDNPFAEVDASDGDVVGEREERR
ncbi:GvpL/GvpF family gas vesicle protein [Streptomyces albipurpureus]|uniref:GvpL/GvpF family gas vesicle protein n=1 Tax=Streptomyces albipurpureus TaxID=2897419 RepID=A0ABT0UPW0_9ACTN|nr:GvpL/GvpF family gas vesicle protein [Streptomyces sp. CWNU-1]MCM2390652.1 GvpL/GvpF family gas vesicle protein [Streptomyces sp. CWNU-1]